MRALITDLIIAACFVLFGYLTPNSTQTSAEGFASNLAGIATGFGVAWMVKSFIEYKKSTGKRIANDVKEIN